MKPRFEGIDATYKAGGDNKDIRDLLEKLVPKAAKQMKDFACKFKGKTQEQTCKNIFDYIKSNFSYVADQDEQIIKLPSALLKYKVGDCKSYSLFTAAILENLGISYKFVYTSYNSNPVPHHVYVTTKAGCIIDVVYGKFNQEKEPIYKYEKIMNVRYMAGIGCADCKSCKSTPVNGWLADKAAQFTNWVEEKVDDVKVVAKQAATTIKQGTNTVVFAAGRGLFMLMLENNIDGMASKIAQTNTSALMDRWYALGGDRTKLAEAIRKGSSRPAKVMNFLSRLKKVVGNTQVNGIGVIPDGIKAGIITACTAAGTAIGGAPQGTAAGASLGAVVVELLPILITILQRTPEGPTIIQSPPTEVQQQFLPAVNDEKKDAPKSELEKYAPYVLGFLAVAGTAYVVSKKSK